MAIQTVHSSAGNLGRRSSVVGVAALFGLLCFSTGGLAGCSNAAIQDQQFEADAVEESLRLELFEEARAACAIGISENFKILDGGEALHLSTRTDLDALDSKVWPDDVECLLAELDAPSALWIKMSATRALDGRQADVWNGLEASWTYHPDNGIYLIIEHE